MPNTIENVPSFPKPYELFRHGQEVCSMSTITENQSIFMLGNYDCNNGYWRLAA